MLATTAERVHRALALTLVGAASILGHAQAGAAQPAQVGVVVEILPKQEGTDVASMMALQWSTPARRAQIEADVAKRFAEQLQQRFRYWQFVPANNLLDATLHLKLIELADGGSTLVFDLQRRQQARTGDVWRKEWMAPGAALANPLPSPAQAPAVIAAALKKRIENPADAQVINDWLTTSVPIGMGGRWIGPAPTDVMELKLVVALPPERLEELSDSTLKILGNRGAQGRRVSLLMTGIGSMEPLEPDAGQPVLGLVVCPEPSSELTTLGVQGARELRIGAILLEKEGPGLAMLPDPEE